VRQPEPSSVQLSAKPGQLQAADVIGRYAELYPAAVHCLGEDLEASLAHLRLPPRHRISARTTNPWGPKTRSQPESDGECPVCDNAAP
jgi:transposase-like protein